MSLDAFERLSAEIFKLIKENKELREGITKYERKFKEIYSSSHPINVEKKIDSLSLLDCLPESIILINEEGKIIYTNHALKGMKNEDVLGSNVMDFVPLDFRNDMQETLRKVAITGETLNFEVPIKSIKGREKWYSYELKCVKKRDEVIGFLVVGQEITHRKTIELELKNGEQKYRSFVDNFQGIAFRSGMDWSVLIFHGAVEKITGFTEDEFINGKITWDQVVHEEDLSWLSRKDYVENYNKPDFKDTREYRIIKKDGEIRWVQDYIQSVIDENGNVIFHQGTIFDITDRKLVEIALSKDIAKRKKVEKINNIQRELALSISATSNLKLIYWASLDAAIKIGEIDCGGVYQVEKNGDLRLAYNVGLSDAFIKKTSYYDVDSVNTRLVMNGVPIYSNYEKLKESIDIGGESLQGLAILPVKHEGEVIACLNLASHVVDEISEETRTALETIAAQIGSAIARAMVEEALQESEEKYRRLFNSGSDSIFVHELNDENEVEKVIEVNDVACQKFGYTRDEILEMGPIDLVISTYEQYKDLLDCLLSNSKAIYERDFITREGKVIPFEVNSHLFDFKGTSMILSIARDVSDRKNAEEKLKESEEKYRLIAENANDLINIFDKEGNLVYINESTHEKLMSYKKDEMLGKTHFILIHPDDREVALLQARKTFENGYAEAEYRLKHGKTGEYRWFNTVAKTFKNSDGEEMMFSISRDVSERKKIEELLEQENLRLKQLDELRMEFVSSATHELKTPLVSLCGSSEFLLNKYKEKLDPEVTSLIELMSRGSTRLRKLIEKLLDFSRIEIGKFSVETSKHDLVEVIRNALIDISYLVEQKGQELILILPERIEMDIDGFRIGQVVSNLISNAMKNTPKGGKIEVRLVEDVDKIKMSVKDNGVGITREEKTKLFEKFGKIERVDIDVATDIQGSGLGLYLSKQIVEKHGGEIWVDSEGRDTGSTFSFTLPKK
ncbi:MAG: PAS domain S-box protein [Candidatus Hodarchaeota archaeon]